MAVELIMEVFKNLPATVTPQERVAALAFAEDAWIKPGHRADRKIFTPLSDPKFQLHIGVSSAKKVQELAQSLARKGVLESVQRGHHGRVAEYRIAHLAPAQHPGNQGAESNPESGLLPQQRPAESTPVSGALQPGSTPESGPLHPGNWGAYSPTPQTPLPACGPVVAADRQAGGELNQDNPAGGYAGPEEPAVLRAAEGPETSGSDGTAEMGQAAAAGPQDAATRVLDAVDFGRQLTRDERTRLTARLSVLLAGGWSVDALVKQLGDLGGAQSRVAVFSTRAKNLPDSAPSIKPVQKAPGTAEVLSKLDAVVAADVAETTEEDRAAGLAFRAQLRAKRAQAAAPAAAGSIAPGAAAKRRDVPTGVSRVGVLIAETDTQFHV